MTKNGYLNSKLAKISFVDKQEIFTFDHIWTWAWPSRSPWGRWQLPPPLIWLATYQSTSVLILVLLSKSAQFGQKWQLIRSTILEPEILGNRNISFNSILISLQWFLIAELYRYLCYGCLKFPARVYNGLLT